MAYNQQSYYNGGYYPQYQNGAVPDMLNQYKGQYQMPIPQPFVQPMQSPVQSNDMIWVLSEVEAQSYPVAPNNSVILWDKNNDVVYIKSVNTQGIPSMRILDYKERVAENASETRTEHECKCSGKFVSKEEFKALSEELDALRGKVEAISAKPKTKTSKASAEDEENG